MRNKYKLFGVLGTIILVLLGIFAFLPSKSDLSDQSTLDYIKVYLEGKNNSDIQNLGDVNSIETKKNQEYQQNNKSQSISGQTNGQNSNGLPLINPAEQIKVIKIKNNKNLLQTDSGSVYIGPSIGLYNGSVGFYQP